MLCFVQPPEPNTHLFRLQLMHYKVNIFDSVIDDITPKKQGKWSRVQSNVQGLIICRFLSQLKISTWYTELQLYEKFKQVLKIFQPRLKYGVIHIARTPKGEGRGQVNAYDCVQGRGRLILAIFVRTNYVMTSIIASKNRIFRRLMK